MKCEIGKATWMKFHTGSDVELRDSKMHTSMKELKSVSPWKKQSNNIYIELWFMSYRKWAKT